MAEQNTWREKNLISLAFKRVERKLSITKRGISAIVGAGLFIFALLLSACGGTSNVKPLEATKSVDPNNPCAPEEIALIEAQQNLKPKEESFLGKLGSAVGNALTSKVPGGMIGQHAASETINEVSITPEERELRHQKMTREDPVSKLMDCRTKHHLDPRTGKPL